MEPRVTHTCLKPDIRLFDGVRCCLSCGFSLLEEWKDADSTPRISAQETNASTTVRYSYCQLNYELGQEIRLAILQPGSFNDDIRCEIIHANLDDGPEFEAVSYTWADKNGHATLCRQILCQNGQHIPITANCDTVLRRIRARGSKRTLWMDMICINQDNVLERNHQVNLMSTIYRSAKEVLVDVGNMDPPSELIFDQLVKYGRNAGSSFVPARALEDFFARRWFHRVWVIQEIALANHATVLCGHRFHNWDFLKDFINSKSTALEKGGQNLILPAAFRIKHGSKRVWDEPELLNLLATVRHCGSTDPRDKIYAILGLLKQEVRSRIPVDYAQDIDILFIQVAALCFSHHKLDLLHHAYSPSLSLPSWVPDWSVFAPQPQLYIQISQADAGPPQSLSTCYPVLVDDQGQELGLEDSNTLRNLSGRPAIRVRGRQLADISMTERRGDYLPNRNFFSSDDKKNEVEQFWLSIWNNRYSPSAPSSKYVSVHGIPPIFRKHHQCTEWCDACHLNADTYFVSNYRPVWDTKRFSQHALDEFLNCSREISRDGTLFGTISTLGYGPPALRTGDGVWMLEGQKVPFVLRRVRDSLHKNPHKLIGTCYFYQANQLCDKCLSCSCKNLWEILDIV